MPKACVSQLRGTSGRIAPVAAIGIFLPELDRVVVAGGRKQLAAGVPRDRFHVLAVALLDVDTLKVVPREAFPDPDGLVSAARRDQASARRERHTLHLVLVPLQNRDLRRVCGQHRTELTAEARAAACLTGSHTWSQPMGVRFQIAVVPSKLAVARLRPPGDHATPRTVLLCVSWSTVLQYHCPVSGSFSQSRTVLSPLQLAKQVPAGVLRVSGLRDGGREPHLAGNIQYSFE